MLNDFDSAKVYEEVMASILPFESWEKLKGESGAAYAAFCVFRDFGVDRNIKKAVASVETDAARRERKYRVWRGWAEQFKWTKRAGDYDVYMDKLKQAERRKMIEARSEVYMKTTDKMLAVINKRLDQMDAGELTQGNVAEWMKAAIGTEREVLGAVADADGDDESRQISLNFNGDFKDL
jgi:hypothetical protein